MTSHDLDRVITQVAGGLTRADARGLGDRVRARLEREPDRPQRTMRAAWWSWAAAGATAVIVAAVGIPRSTPGTSSDPIVASVAPQPAVAPVSPVPSRNEVSHAVTAVRRPRAASPKLHDASPAEQAWLARALPALPEPAPVDIQSVDLTPLEARILEVPALVIEPLGTRDVNK